MPVSYRIHIWVALGLAAASLAVAVLTLVPGAPVVPGAVAFGLFGSALPVFGLGVLRCARAGVTVRGPDFLWIYVDTPRWVLVCAVAMMAGAVTCLVGGDDPGGGRPVKEAGGYYLTGNGKREAVSRETYVSAVKAEQRWFDTGGTVFLANAAVLAGAAYRNDKGRTARITVTPPAA